MVTHQLAVPSGKSINWEAWIYEAEEACEWEALRWVQCCTLDLQHVPPNALNVKKMVHPAQHRFCLWVATLHAAFEP